MPKSNAIANLVNPTLSVLDADVLQPLAVTDQIAPLSAIGVLPSIVAASQALAATGLGSTPVTQPGNLSTLKPNDVYSFSVTGTDFAGYGNINLSLRNISAGDDADLLLYRDSNSNGVLDGSDALVGGSFRGGNADDSLTVRQPGGNYFAKVQRYAPGSSGDVQYTLDLSSAKPSNLFPKENTLGSLSSGTKTRTGSINDLNTSDIFTFSQGRFRKTRISLSGLSNDADIRVIKDRNNNQIFDSADVVVGTSTRGGTSAESITVKGAGSYITQIYQYSGNTNYTLGLNTSFSLF